MCVYLFAPSRGQPLCFSLCLKFATLGKIKTFQSNFKHYEKYLTRTPGW